MNAIDSVTAAPRATWPLDAWYVAASAEEVGSKPLARQITGLHMVFFRTGGGVVTALEDFCPHRGAPLSLGFVRGETLVCGYHGLALDCRGRSDSMPGQQVGKFPSARHFPVIERYGFVWVWPGDPAQANADKLHPLPWAESPDWAYGGGLFHIACDYRLMIDNLMDLTHETYVHASSIGQKEIDEAPVRTEATGDEVVTSRHMENVAAPPFWRMGLRGAGLPEDALVDRWQVCRFTLPSHVMIEVGVALAGEGGYHADPAKKASSIVVDFITPETETSHWYFWGMARQFAVDDAALTDTIREGQRKIFSEDLEMLERQQRNLSQYPDRKLLKLNIDAGGVRSRLMIDRAIAQEQAAAE
ncbi:Rieske 2Fe-2S domain-containing protein [Sphingomonas sp. Marseille-Q8236]